MWTTFLFALIALSVVIYGIIEKDKERMKKNLTAIAVGVAIFILYLFAANGRYVHTGGYFYLDKWTGREYEPSNND